MSNSVITHKRRDIVRRNILFEKWLTHAMETAFTKELKSYNAYKKALSSLKKYPLMLGSAKECRILEGFGPKLCDFLEEKLLLYAEELGISPSEALEYGNNEVVGPSSMPGGQSRLDTATPVPDTTPISLECTSNLATDVSIVPTFRSPVLRSDVLPFESIVLHLFESSKNPLGCTRQELTECLHSHGPEYVTPSISICLDRLMAHGLIESVAELHDTYRLVREKGNFSTTGTQNLIDSSESVSLDRTPATVPTEMMSSSRCSTTDYPLQFVYLNENDEEVKAKSLALVKFFDSDDTTEMSVGYRISCSYEDLIVTGLPYRMDWSVTSPFMGSSGSAVAYLLDPNAPNECTKSASKPLTDLPISETPTTPLLPHTDCTRPPICTQVDVNHVAKRHTHTTQFLASRKFHFKHATSAVASSIICCEPVQLLSTRSQPVSPAHPRSVTMTPSLQMQDSSTFIVPSGVYTLVLLADIRETFGLNRVKQMLPPVLHSLGVECESRALPVGDFLWVARWQTDSGERMEAVLDYIIERKRADDLASSIIDGRFHEQKYRMKRTQLFHAIYLIEDCPSMRNQRIPYDSLIQAVSNAQVTDGFQVMTTRCPEDTVDLLAALSHTLHEHCLKADLQVYTPTGCSLDPCLQRYLRAHSWTNFVQLANKSRPPTIRDVFAKQLLQIHGCSGPKVAAVLDSYPTPLSLFQAYDVKVSQEAKENMLASLKVAQSNRTLGNALSRRIYQAYSTL